MSEPVSNARVEDVLASIRRLVSHEDRPARGQGAPSGDEVARDPDGFGSDGRPALGGRFVLTPSLRVSDPEPDPENRQAAESDVAAETAAVSRNDDLNDEIRSEASLGAGSLDPVPAEATKPRGSSEEPGEAAAEDLTSVLRLDASVRLPDDATDVPAGQGEAAASVPDAPDIATGTPGATTESTNLVRTVDDDDDASVEEPEEPDESDADDDVSDAHRVIGPAMSANPAKMMDDADTEPAEDVPQAQSRRDILSSTDVALESKIAALEAAIARTDDNWEPDGVAGDAYSGTTPPAMNWDAPETATKRNVPYRLEPEARRDVPAALPAGVLASMAGRLDEDMLREIVADTVRQELQGALGERITRNVRKLVRREILRALASKEFD